MLEDCFLFSKNDKRLFRKFVLAFGLSPLDELAAVEERFLSLFVLHLEIFDVRHIVNIERRLSNEIYAENYRTTDVCTCLALVFVCIFDESKEDSVIFG